MSIKKLLQNISYNVVISQAIQQEDVSPDCRRNKIHVRYDTIGVYFR